MEDEHFPPANEELMNYEIQNITPVLRKVDVSVPANEVDGAIEEYRKKKQVVDTSILKKATEALMESLLAAIFTTEGLDPVCVYQLEEDLVAAKRDYSFTALIEVLPDIDLPDDLASLSVTVPPPLLEPGIGRMLLHSVLKRSAHFTNVEASSCARNGDLVLIDMRGRIDGNDAPCMCKNNVQVEVQSEGKKNIYGMDLSHILRGMRSGGIATGSILCPADHPHIFLREKEVEYMITLHGIKRPAAGQPTDDVAKELGFENVQDLNKFIYSKAMNIRLKEIRQEGRHRLLKQLLAKATFPLPESIVASHLRERLSGVRQLLQAYGLEQGTITERLKAMHSVLAEEAKELAKEEVFLLVLASKENIEVYEAELKTHIEDMAKENNKSYYEMHSFLQQQDAIKRIHNGILAAKALNYLYDKAQKIVIKDTNTSHASLRRHCTRAFNA